jgi:hypothetical protein
MKHFNRIREEIRKAAEAAHVEASKKIGSKEYAKASAYAQGIEDAYRLLLRESHSAYLDAFNESILPNLKKRK